METASARGGFGDELYEKEAIQTRVRKIFMDQLRDDHWRVFGHDGLQGRRRSHVSLVTFQVVDGRRSKEEIAHDIFAIAKSVVEIAACEPLHKDLFVKS